MRPIASLLAGVALLLLGAGLLNTLIPLRGSTLGFSDTLLGTLTSAYFIGFFLGTYAATPLIRRIGHIRAFAFCAACCACVVLLHAIDANPWLWVVLRLLAGMALVILYTVIESWLNATASPEQRGTVFATYMVVNLGALAAAQQLLHLDSPKAFVLFTVVALLICAATMPVLLTRMIQPVLQPRPRLELRRLFRAAPSAGAGALLSGLTMGAFWGLAPVYVTRQGFAADQVGTYMSVAILGGAVMQWPLGRLSDRHDRRLALMVTCGLAAGIAAMAPLLTYVPFGPYLAIFVFGGMSFAIYPIVVAHLLDHLPPEDLVSASSSVLLLNGLGSAIGPLIAGVLMSTIAPWALFAWFAVTEGLLALYAGYRYQVRHRELNEDSQFMPMMRTTPAAFEMLPGLEGEHEEQGAEAAWAGDGGEGAFAEDDMEATTAMADDDSDEDDHAGHHPHTGTRL
ncbi:MFS transporter [Oleiagrimonas sp. C23AA]|uniref:MFS transporter n=1 Tax=Oleiagrimonas sp. C23AA TaxID=2719047 RepID=UPI00141E5B23|nr:MFS transporter [Oleiagrimonas sp. C23AA]